MNTIYRETQGDTLTGAIDGTNMTYHTSKTFDFTFVNVFVNGLLIDPDDIAGYTLGPQTVAMNAPLIPGDTLEVEYRAPVAVAGGGGAGGGVPQPPEAEVIAPQITSQVLKPTAI